MVGSSHAILGASAAGVALITTGTNLVERPVIFLISWAVGIMAALLPDIDTPNAKIRHIFGVGKIQSQRELRQWRNKGYPARGLDLFQWIAARILDVLDWFLPHRGITHWGITFLAVTAAAWFIVVWLGIPRAVAIAFSAGYASHILGDGVTRAGVPLYAPFYRRSVRLLPRTLCIRTGSFQEKVLLYSLIFIMAAYLFGWITLLYRQLI